MPATKNTSEKNRPPIPTIRCSRDDVNRIMGLFAAITEFDRCEKEMEQRVRACPNGWRDLRLIESTLDRLVENILQTVPIEKLQSIKRMMPGMQYKSYYGRPASIEKDETIIQTESLDVLTDFAHEHCKFCIDGNCNNCKLGKVLDSILAEDRDGQSWGFIDISRGT